MNHTSVQPTDLSIIIVNWRSQAFVRKCLESIVNNAGALVIQTIVIDNASYDGCEQMVKSHFPDAVFIQSQQNLGFATANNLAFARSTGRDILFLNPDTEIQGAALQCLLGVLHSSPRIGMVGARLLKSDLSLQDNCITALPTILNQALSSDYLRRGFPRSRLWGNQAFFATPQTPAQVEAISGACMLAKREVIEAVHGFNTGYFMYAEDMDLCVRVAKAGWAIYYVPDAVIVHHAEGSSASRQESSFSSVMIRESVTHFFSLHRGPLYAGLYRASSILASGLRLLLLLAFLPFALTPTKRQLVLGAIKKWGNILAWSLGLNKWVIQQLGRRPDVRFLAAPELKKLPDS